MTDLELEAERDLPLRLGERERDLDLDADLALRLGEREREEDGDLRLSDADLLLRGDLDAERERPCARGEMHTERLHAIGGLAAGLVGLNGNSNGRTTGGALS